MSISAIIAIVLGSMILAFLVYAYSLPAKWKAEESIRIQAEPGEIFRFIGHIKNWEQWTVWNKEVDSRYHFQYEGPEFGVGAMQSWNQRGRKGYMKFTGMEQARSLRYVLNLGRGAWQMEGEILIRETPEGSEVTWLSQGDNKTNPAGRVRMKMFLPYMRKDFQAGLVRLKEIMESGAFPEQVPAPDETSPE